MCFSSFVNMFTDVKDPLGKVYTAADIRHMGLFEPTAAQRGRFDINFWGALISAKYITTKGYINRGGSITMTIGSSFSKPMKGWAMAAAVTGAIDGLTRGLAVELAPIRVNTISPGYVDTDASVLLILLNGLLTACYRSGSEWTRESKPLWKIVSPRRPSSNMSRSRRKSLTRTCSA